MADCRWGPHPSRCALPQVFLLAGRGEREREGARRFDGAYSCACDPPTAQLGNERPSAAGLFLRPPDTAPITAHLRGWFPITPLISNPTCRRGQAGRRQSYKPLKAIKCKDNNEGAACRCQGPGLPPSAPRRLPRLSLRRPRSRAAHKRGCEMVKWTEAAGRSWRGVDY